MAGDHERGRYAGEKGRLGRDDDGPGVQHHYHHHIHHEFPPAVEQALREISLSLQRLENSMSAITDAVAHMRTEVTETKAGIDSVLVLLRDTAELMRENAESAVAIRALADELEAKQVEIATATTNPGPNPAPPA